MIEETRKRLPPYISYRTFGNFLDGLEHGMPARIDRSYWGDKFSGSTGIQLTAALRFLGLVDTNNLPTNRLKSLVSAKGDKKSEILRQIATDGYVFLFQEPVDPKTATYAQVQEAFHHSFQLSGDVSRKCIKFFVALAGEGGIPLSTFITRRVRLANAGAAKANSKKTRAKRTRNLIVPQSAEETSGRMSWDKLLLTKFPTFDPAWPDDVKLKWFEAFNQLLQQAATKSTP